MCIIIVKKEKGQGISDDILSKSAALNQHGLGITWLDTYETRKDYKSSDWRILKTERPFIAHFRKKTVGKVCIANNHPFPIKGTECQLYQNGTVLALGDEAKTDAEHMSEILSATNPKYWGDILSMNHSRWVIVDKKSKTYKLYNLKMWHEHEGVMYSKRNVLDDELVAVYGTLKQGHSNHRLLFGAEFIGEGNSVNKYPMVCSGVPFVFDRPGEGHNIDVEVFSVNSYTLNRLDQLEGHPDWYERRKTFIKTEYGDIKCWLYFCDGARDTGVYEKTFTSSFYTRPSTQLTALPTYLGDYTSNIYDGLTCPQCKGSDTLYDDFSDSCFCNDCEDYTLTEVIYKIEKGFIKNER